MVMPSASAALRFTISRNFEGSTTGSSATLVPLENAVDVLGRGRE